MTSVLVVDDSRSVRNVVASTLTDHGYEVGTASDGQEAIDLVQMCDPDVVTMDVRMPGMDGIETVEEIMAVEPTPIVMLSAHTAKGGEATIRALARGAVDFLHKPGGENDVDMDELEARLIDTIEAVEGAPVESLVPPGDQPDDPDPEPDLSVEADSPEAPTVDTDAASSQRGPAESPPTSGGTRGVDPPEEEFGVDLPVTVPDAGSAAGSSPTIAIGASTGGPKVVEAILGALPGSLDARILVVQHMPPSFTDRLSAHLDEVSDYDVTEATDGATVGPGEALVAKGDHHMRVTDEEDDRLVVSLSRDRRVHSVRPSVDVTMGSLVDVGVDSGTLVGVVLTGMGKDGAVGIESIKSVGGTTFVQNEATSPVFSMPRNAIETGCVDRILPPEEIPEAICDAVRDREREEAHA